MRTQLQITTIVDHPEVLESLVEELAYRRNDTGYGNTPVPLEWQAIDISSTEASVNGKTVLNEVSGDEQDRINMPFTTCFLFTCTKAKNGIYKIEWSLSLS